MGLACVQFAVAEGMRVFGTASTKEGTERVMQSGAHFCFDHSKENYVQDVRVRQIVFGIFLTHYALM